MAGRIPQHFIDQLLSRTDIVDLIDGYVPLKKAGVNYKACCPFHDEKTPSFTVSSTKQFYHCFGCGANGSVIGFLMDYDHLEFREAIEKLASSAGLEIPQESQSFNKPKQSPEGIDLYQLMNHVSQFYLQQLRQHPDRQQAVNYLKQRDLSGDIANRFDIGFAPQGWSNLMDALGQDEATQKALVDTGMLSKNEKDRIYDRFRHRIMFPIHDHRGRIVGFGGRVIDDSEPKYLNSPETPIFHKGSELYGLYAARGGIKEADGVLVVEGYMDVVALAQSNINNAVATLGTATTQMHLQRLFRHTQNITFCFDGDRAGKAAAWKALQTSLQSLQDGYQISFLFLPDGEDPDSMVRKTGQARFQQLIDKATPLPDFLIDTLSQKADLNRLDGRAKMVQLAKPLLAQFPDGVLRQLVADQIAKLVQANPSDLLGSSGNNQATSKQSSNSLSSGTANAAPRMTPIRRCISILLQNPSFAHKVPNHEELSTLSVRGMDLLIELIEQCIENPEITTAVLLERYRQQTHFSALENLASRHHFDKADKYSSTALSVDGLFDLFISSLAMIKKEYYKNEHGKLTQKGIDTLSSIEIEAVRELENKIRRL